MPASISLRRIHHGVGAVGSTPLTWRATNRAQPARSSMWTGHTSPSASGTSTTAASPNATSNAHAISRASPRTEKA